MRKLKLVSLLIVLALAISMLTACGSDPIQGDLKSYVNEKISAVQTPADKAFSGYNAVAGDNYKDDATMLAAVNATVVPSINEALEAAKKITPATKEVGSINDMFITALTSYSGGYKALQEALTNTDKSKADEAKTLLEKAETQKSDFMTALDKLAKDHGIKINTVN